MADANMVDFYDRVRRFERMRSSGQGFEAAGALGRSYYKRHTEGRRGWFIPVVASLFVVFALKAGLFIIVGSADYEDRVARLMAGQGFDPVGGWIMQADPVTLWTADKLEVGLANLF